MWQTYLTYYLKGKYNNKNKKQYNNYVNNKKNSVMTGTYAFYVLAFPKWAKAI